MPFRFIPPLLPTLIAIGSLTASDAPQRWQVGNPADVAPSSPTSGGLMLMGGGGDVDTAFQWFLQQAGGGDVVVLRSSGSDGYNPYLMRELGIEVDSVETILLTSREQSFDADLAATLAGAEAIFLAGGDQSNYVRFWQHTPVENALNAHVAAGKPLGGTSAGLAVMGRHVYAAMHDGDLTSKLAIKSPDHRYITLIDDFLHLPFLQQVLTDSHFSERARLGRLMVMVHRIAQAQNGQPPLGLGLDERTALCVEASGVARVLTADRGQVHLVSLAEFNPATPEGAVAAVISLGSDSTFDLASLNIENPDAEKIVRITRGKLEALEPIQP